MKKGGDFHVTAFEKEKIWLEYLGGKTIPVLVKKYGYSYQTVRNIIQKKASEKGINMQKGPLKEAERQHIKEMLLNGARTRQIEIATGRSSAVISEIRRQLGIKAARPVRIRRVTAQERQAIIKMAGKGMAISEIARKANRSDTTVRKIINAARDAAERNEKNEQ